MWVQILPRAYPLLTPICIVPSRTMTTQVSCNKKKQVKIKMKENTNQNNWLIIL